VVKRSILPVWLLAIGFTVCGGLSAAGAAELTVEDPDGAQIEWSSWLRDNGPVAVVLWASWVPDADASIREFPAIAEAAASKGLDALLVSVQESANETRASLGGADLPWVNDRFGGLLKQFRVVKIPSVVVVGPDGVVIARLDADAGALREWKRE
jgi:hypothetical protein